MNKIIDLRSDTVTVPTQRMRQAMFDAPVGDDVLGEDPTVQRLEAMAAEVFGKEAALFVVSGTMANQTAVMTLCSRGDQMIVHDRSHIYNLEVGGLAATCGVQPRPLRARGGRYDLAELESEIHRADIQRAPTTLICLENTFDLNRGLVVPTDHTREVCDLAHRRSVRVYMDGARIFNAAVAQGSTAAELVGPVDVVGTCLSKGLGCPVGSLLAGTRAFVAEARRMRQRLGGGWRQAGVLAAAGIVGLEEMVERLAEDHEKARRLGGGLHGLGVGVDMSQVQTNIVHVDLSPLGISSEVFCSRMSERSIRVKPVGPMEVRMVTHKDIAPGEIDATIEAVQQCFFGTKADALVKSRVHPSTGSG